MGNVIEGTKVEASAVDKVGRQIASEQEALVGPEG